MSQNIAEEKQGDTYLNFLQAVESKQYRVDGQGAIGLVLNAEDKLHIASQDGEQGCELIVLDHQGQLAANLLSEQKPCQSINIKQQLQQSGSASMMLNSQFNAWQIETEHLQQVLAFDGGETLELTAKESLVVVIVAAGKNMLIDQHNPPTELTVTVNYANPVEEVLPEPLAEVKAEIRIDKATAQTYEVKAGEWIQIIDVSGKQCSDFIAFDKAALENGQEVGLDATATRTIMGLSNPVPGLHSRFLGPDMMSMVEVVQDTVGRHDSFLFACTAKYYEDSGYFGHVSCSENFNTVLASYGIKPRAGWPAINLFFNTGIEPCGTVFMDEPWSRAGDYVLMRAEKDLICASSACPDDIDPANGWVPTDIHVRIYDAEHHFPRSIAHRISAEEQPRMTKTSGFHNRTAALTSKFIEYAGYWVASEYQGWGATAEYLACRERVALLDLTPLRKIEITGPDAVDFLQYVLTQDVRKMAVGEIAHSAVCLETGGMIDDGTIFRMSEHAYRWFCSDDYNAIWMIEKAKQKGFKVSIRNATDQIHNLAVQGPNSRELLSQIIWTSESQTSVEKLKWFHFTIGRLGGPNGGGPSGLPVMVSRTGYTGELGYEVWCHPDSAEAVWDAIWQAGQAFDIAPMGFDALDMLRIEAGLSMGDYEFSHDVTPFEAGTGFSVPLTSKQEDFIGREALARENPASRHKLMGLILEGGEAAAHGDLVYQGRFPVGVVTSATMSPLLGKQIALIRVAPDYAKQDSTLEVGKLDGIQKRLSGKVVKLPFYDPKRARLLS
jgi:aminomethyltransferase